MIYFTGSDWCTACIMLKEDYFSKKIFKKISDKFALYEADFPKDRSRLTKEIFETNQKLKKQYDIIGFPSTLILNKDG